VLGDVEETIYVVEEDDDEEEEVKASHLGLYANVLILSGFVDGQKAIRDAFR